MSYAYQLSETSSVAPDDRGHIGRGYESIDAAKAALWNRVDAQHVTFQMDESGEQINAYDLDMQDWKASYLGCIWGD